LAEEFISQFGAYGDGNRDFIWPTFGKKPYPGLPEKQRAGTVLGVLGLALTGHKPPSALAGAATEPAPARAPVKLNLGTN
jgi:hypothetical protein